MDSSVTLTPGQRRVLEILAVAQNKQDVSPTYQELADALGRGIYPVRIKLEALLRKGMITRKGVVRSIRVTQIGFAAIGNRA